MKGAWDRKYKFSKKKIHEENTLDGYGISCLKINYEIRSWDVPLLIKVNVISSDRINKWWDYLLLVE